MELAVVFLLSFLAAPQSAGDAPETSDAQTHEFRLRIPPGETFAANVLINAGEHVRAEFEAPAVSFRYAGVAHPTSDLIEEDGAITVKCPGLMEHEVAILVQGESKKSAMEIGGKERGHYSLLWHNGAEADADLDVMLIFSSSSQILFTEHNGEHFRR